MTARRILGLWGPLAAYMAALLWVSGPLPLRAAPANGDKFLHAAAYGALAALALRAFQGGLGPVSPRAALAALGLTVGYGVVAELLQALVPGRDCSGWDMTANAVGAVLVMFAMAGLLGVGGRWLRTPPDGDA